MCNDKNGRSHIPELFQHIRRFYHMSVIKPACRFIQQQDLPPGSQGAYNGQPLFLPSGQTLRVTVLLLSQIQPAKERCCSFYRVFCILGQRDQALLQNTLGK